VILGHLGEAIPFQLARMGEAFARPGATTTDFAAVFRRNFHITTSGFFSDPALRCCIEEMGVGRILFAVDYPYVKNRDGVEWLRAYPMDEADRDRILAGNARTLLRL
jgi:predicted TIM-barrel fold metal-dependent hydrolase